MRRPFNNNSARVLLIVGTLPIGLKVAAVSRGDGVSDLVDHVHGVTAREGREAAFWSARALDMKREIVPR